MVKHPQEGSTALSDESTSDGLLCIDEAATTVGGVRIQCDVEHMESMTSCGDVETGEGSIDDLVMYHETVTATDTDYSSCDEDHDSERQATCCDDGDEGNCSSEEGRLIIDCNDEEADKLHDRDVSDEPCSERSPDGGPHTTTTKCVRSPVVNLCSRSSLRADGVRIDGKQEHHTLTAGKYARHNEWKTPTRIILPVIFIKSDHSYAEQVSSYRVLPPTN